MSDMTVEKAREIVERDWVGDPLKVKAQGFLEGHASRDEEIAELRKEVSRLSAIELSYKHFLEILTPEKDAGETCQQTAKRLILHGKLQKFSIEGKKKTNAALYAELHSERQKTRALVEAAKKAPCRHDVECDGYCVDDCRGCALDKALKPFTGDTPIKDDGQLRDTQDKGKA